MVNIPSKKIFHFRFIKSIIPVLKLIYVFRKYIPELKEYPIEYLFEPWKAPINIQEAAKCIIGKDYPMPCIDHERASRENDKKMRNYFSSILNEDFENFLKKKLKPSNVEEFKTFIFASIFTKNNSD